MKTKIIAVCVLAALVVIIIINSVTTKNKSGEPVITVGVIGTLTGDFGSYGQLVQTVTDRYANNASIKVVIENDECEPAKAIAAYTKLTTIDKAVVIVGPLCAIAQEAVIPLAERDGIPVILNASASERVYEKTTTVKAVQISIEDEARYIAQQIVNKDYKNIAVIYYKNPFSVAYTNAARAEFEKLYKGKITYYPVTGSDSDINTLVLQVAKTNPDALFIPEAYFFIHSGMSILQKNQVTADVYATYSATIPGIREVSQGVYYPYLTTDNESNLTAIEVYTQKAFDTIQAAIKGCDGAVCVAHRIKQLPSFVYDGDANYLENNFAMYKM